MASRAACPPAKPAPRSCTAHSTSLHATRAGRSGRPRRGRVFHGFRHRIRNAARRTPRPMARRNFECRLADGVLLQAAPAGADAPGDTVGTDGRGPRFVALIRAGTIRGRTSMRVLAWTIVLMVASGAMPAGAQRVFEDGFEPLCECPSRSRDPVGEGRAGSRFGSDRGPPCAGMRNRAGISARPE